ncbi:23S rRNA (guanosine(2251)-2'-O)-methyltransferase, partial [hydrothermal vent metagenome]
MQYHRKKNTPPAKAKKPSNSTSKAWIWGTHACYAALNNPKRVVLEVLASRNAYAKLPKSAMKLAGQPCEPTRISATLPTGAVHQGIALQIAPLPPVTLEQILPHLTGPLIMLDGVTDPRNIGAIFRSAAAFGASAIIAQDRHMPPLTGV